MITIIGSTWKELLRKRVMLLTLLMTVIFLFAFWFVAKTIGASLHDGTYNPSDVQYIIAVYERSAMILSLGFFFGSFVIAFLSIFSSFSVIAGEAEQGVLQALMTRPLSRLSWYMGRWIGFVSWGIGYAALLFISILLVAWAHAGIPGDIVSLARSFALFIFVVPLLVSLSMLGSCHFSSTGNGVLMTMLYGAGWLGGMIEKVAGSVQIDQNIAIKPLLTIAGIMSLVMPADSLQNRMQAELFAVNELQGLVNIRSLFGFFGVGQVPSNAFLMYSAGYMLVMLLLGLWSFRRKDL
ncbi:ABC transporter permease [Paenibacillus tyrfis]|uniref:ABC transporter permease n=1 Tax=Paenibacillus TaxID=44249 RepID=UPI002492C9F4|nr:ABC transporter permease subunit [Paenibacillus tyrfis]GLI08400.1 ABC transporter permease [Paenibacillus tyrfis]GMX66917.1 ABC transporter permease [Paenibacillus elgii]